MKQLKMQYVIQTHKKCVLWELWAQAQETVEHRVCDTTQNRDETDVVCVQVC